MTNKRILLLIALLPLLAFGCNKGPSYKTKNVNVGGHEVRAQIADTEELQDKGLGGRASLGENDGMLFQFAAPGRYAFWMKGMNFPIDFIWIKDGKVVGITPNAPTEIGVPDATLHNYLPAMEMDSALEVNTGWAAKNQIKIGDSVDVQP